MKSIAETAESVPLFPYYPFYPELHLSLVSLSTSVVVQAPILLFYRHGRATSY